MKYISRDKKQVTRRDFLGSAVAAAGAITLMTPMSKGTASVCSDTKPNILMVMTDQQTASAMSCMGNPYLHTPALDALAARGVRFDKAYVTQPLCMPLGPACRPGVIPMKSGCFVTAWI